jgi:hypothetical protein
MAVREQLFNHRRKSCCAPRDGRVREQVKDALLPSKGWRWMQIADALLLSEEMLRHQLKWCLQKSAPSKQSK